MHCSTKDTSSYKPYLFLHMEQREKEDMNTSQPINLVGKRPQLTGYSFLN